MRAGRLRAFWAAAAMTAVLLPAAGCTADPSSEPQQTESVPFAGCASLTAPPAGTAVASPAVAATPLPGLRLPCFAGGTPIDVRALRGPAVINFWAGWCPPCREELPALQRLADQSAGRLHVVGVNTADDRGRALSVAEDLGLDFPQLVDPDRRFLRSVQRTALPLTIFVDDSGDMRLLHQESVLDDAMLARLVEQELRVAVAR
ncbi:TlpA family protein disulfide reductase [Solwaraspora sp. WMMB335]|uniref:TlpA family protein disulfide reductase n=1 Tax=Solwaraspora sp. WMMB335 TaxID=3404118 RepID=UPI003B92FD7E